MTIKQVKKSITIDNIKTEGDGLAQGQFEGYASVFGNVDSYGDRIMPGAFANTLKDANNKVSMFFNHDSWDMPVGKWLSMEEDDYGLKVRGELTPGLSKSADILAAMRHGTVEGMSVSFSMKAGTFLENEFGGVDISDIYVLREVSLCTYPANDQAVVTSLKSIKDLGTIRDVERHLRDAGGFSKTEAQALISRIKSSERGDHEEEAELQKFAESMKNFTFTK